MNNISSIIKLIRPYQWAKNVLIFLPLFFHGTILNLTSFLDVFFAFAGFSLIASSVYCFNDIHDIETDKMHPKKSKRPLASGIMSKKTALVVLVVAFIAGCGVIFIGDLHYEVILWALIYYILNVFYTLIFKKYAIIDTFIIALGFVIRILIGSVAGNVELSQWIIIMSFLLALFLSFAKRRDDLVIFKNTGQIQRQNIIQYNLEFLNIIFGILASVIIVAYIMYTISPDISLRFGEKNVYYSTIFVIAGILRYIQLSIVRGNSDDPTKILFKDRFLLLCVFGWILFFISVIYF